MLALDKLDSAEIGHYLAAQGVLADRCSADGGSARWWRLEHCAQGSQRRRSAGCSSKRCLNCGWKHTGRPALTARCVRLRRCVSYQGTYRPALCRRSISSMRRITSTACHARLIRRHSGRKNLLAGEVELPVAAAAGRMLAQMHAIQDPAVRERFIDDEVFWQLRVDPYYNTIAEKYPSVKPVVARAIAQMKARKLALVHGDFSPKNMFVLREKMDSRASGNDGLRRPAECSTISSTGASVT